MKVASQSNGAEIPLFVFMMASAGCNKVLDKFSEVLNKLMAIMFKGRKVYSQ